MAFPKLNLKWICKSTVLFCVACVSPLLWAQAQVTSTPLTVINPTAPAVSSGLSSGTSTGTAAESGRVYIAVGAPNVKKVLMAVEPTSGSGSVVSEFNSTLQYNMDFTDLFEILPTNRMPKQIGDLAAYRVLGVEFLLRSTVTVENNAPVAELRLIDVNRGTQILGRRYPLVGKSTQAGRELAHYAANDVVESLTGTKGIFRTRILMSCGDKRKEIYIMDFDGQNVRQITRDGNFALSPTWAPDGNRIAFTSYRPATKGGFINPNLYMVELANNTRTLLSAARGLNTGAAFHPTENKIAYTFSQDGKPEIYFLDLVKKQRARLTRTQFFSVEPNFSPDGNRLVYSSSETGQPHVFISNVDGTAKRRLTFAGRYNSSPNWSPIGDKIVFSGQEFGRNNFNIFMIDPTGSNLLRLTSGSDSSENPVFSPDGRHIIYSSNQGGKYRIHVMTARGERARAISPVSLGACKQPAWSPRL